MRSVSRTTRKKAGERERPAVVQLLSIVRQVLAIAQPRSFVKSRSTEGTHELSVNGPSTEARATISVDGGKSIYFRRGKNHSTREASKALRYANQRGVNRDAIETCRNLEIDDTTVGTSATRDAERGILSAEHFHSQRDPTSRIVELSR